MLIRRIARPMLAATFVSQGAESLASPSAAADAADAARPATEGLRKLPVAGGMPDDPQTVARITAVAQIGGGLLLASGRLPRVAAAALAATVVPANLGTRTFWNESDPARRADQRRRLVTDVSLLGGLLIASADTAGRPSLGWLGRRAARTVSHGVSEVAESAVERGSEVAEGALAATKEGVRRLTRSRLT